ncbi:plasmid maintenance system killer [Candidatus Peregrinibacteria bacterium CG_4_10_14_0_2_um_filter_38_24]|nr:MAG: plasmid maintenance system killer [Candidatus Peregrinibacteria bacterium CG_4_10_14_0_2_um_filter_38_24]PJC39310.1 MAG: plasmid maintenance system killer [Candidatus Peregrinibacteria bacterium CG_4_9_14_0_2_um_filter_38_9]
MIKSFKDKEAEKIFNREMSRKLPPEIQRISMRKVWMIDAAMSINDLRIPPSNHLEQLKGDRKGQYSVRINDKWRICFEWKNGEAHEVEITNYHK